MSGATAAGKTTPADQPISMERALPPAARRQLDALRDQHRFRSDLVLAGGGVKGIAHVGALLALRDHGYTDFPHIAGTSVGAIVGAMFAVHPDRSAAWYRQQLAEFPFELMQDRAPPIPGWRTLRGLARLRFDHGANTGDALLAHLDQLLGGKTFGDLQADRRARRAAIDAERGIAPAPPPTGAEPWPLVILATDVTSGRLRQFPRDYALYSGPDGKPLRPAEQKISDAVRASISIPLFFEPHEIGGHEFVDGGVLANYAVDVFDRVDDDGRLLAPRWTTFGVSLFAADQAEAVGRNIAGRSLPPAGLQELALGSLSRFLYGVIGTLVIGQDAEAAERWWMQRRSIGIDTIGTELIEFNVPSERRAALIDAAYATTTAFLLERWDGDDGRVSFPLPEELGSAQRDHQAAA